MSMNKVFGLQYVFIIEFIDYIMIYLKQEKYNDINFQTRITTY